MPHTAFVIPGDIDLATGGYAYDRRVLALLPQQGVSVEHVALTGGWPQPTTGDVETAASLLAGIDPDAVLLIDGLAYGAMPATLLDRVKQRIVALVHHPLCLEAGLSAVRQDDLKRLETAALARARHVVVTSPATARTLVTDFAVPRARITVALPGTDPAPRARGSTDVLRLLAVGSIIPRKGYDVLIEALAPLRSLSWHLDIAGGLEHAPETVASLRRQIEARGLGERVTLLGAVGPERLAGLYDRADVFVMSSLYEGFGMVLTEAVARGLPIVCTDAGVATELLPDDAVLKCQPGEARALMWTAGRLIEDKGLRARYGDAAWAAAAGLPRWPDTALAIARVIADVSEERAG